MFRRILFPLFLFAIPAVTFAGSEWMHVRIVDHRHSSTRVSVNVPLSLAETVAAMLPTHECRHGAHMRIDGASVTAKDLRAGWGRVRGGADGQVVTVGDRFDELKVWKSNGNLVMQSTGFEPSTVVMPGGVADALLSGQGNELNVAAAVRALARAGQGELTVTTEDEATVRVWVDVAPEGGRR